MADVDRPVKRQRHLFKHGPIEPLVLALEPQSRMGDLLFLDPSPVRSAPECRSSYPPSRTNRRNSPFVTLWALIAKAGTCDGMLFKLVVPAKHISSARNSQRGKSCRDVDHPGSDWRPGSMGSRQAR